MPIFLRTVIGNCNYELKLDWSKKSVKCKYLGKSPWYVLVSSLDLGLQRFAQCSFRGW